MSINLFGQGNGAGRPPLAQRGNYSSMFNPAGSYGPKTMRNPTTKTFDFNYGAFPINGYAENLGTGSQIYQGQNKNLINSGFSWNSPGMYGSNHPIQRLNQESTQSLPYPTSINQPINSALQIDGTLLNEVSNPIASAAAQEAMSAAGLGGGLFGSIPGIGAALGGLGLLGGMLGYSKLDLGRERKELGNISGNFQAKGDEAWKFGEELRSGTGKFYDTAKNEIGRQADTLLASMRTSSGGAPSAAAYRRNMGDMRRQMYEQMNSAMNQMYATGLQQSAQYGGLASDLWRNRIGAEQAIAQMLEAENKSANEPYGQLMNMGGSILGGLLGGILG